MGAGRWQVALFAVLVTAALGWLGAAGADAYVIGGKPWPGGVIRYYNADPGMKSEVAAATKAWNTSGARVHFVAVPRSQAQVIILGWPKHAAKGFEAGFGSLGWVPPGTPGVDPWGHLVRGAHVWLEPVDVANARPPALMTLVATHELGHVLGLGHSTRCATMDSELVANCKAAPHGYQLICRPLQPDDVAGAIHLYGGRARPLGPQRYCPYFPAAGPPTKLTATVLRGGYGTADSVRLSWRAPKGVRLNYTGTGNSVGSDEVFASTGHCAVGKANQLAVDYGEKPGAVNQTTVEPATPGRWCVTVEIFDVYQRAGGKATIWVTVPGPAPVASFGDTQDQFNGLLFHFQDQSGVSGATYAWNFGDPTSGAANTSTRANPSHTFSAPGSYQVTETVTDAFGQSNSSTQTVDAANYPAPTANFDDSCSTDGYCSLTSTSPYPVQFSDSSTDPDGSIVAWSWNFGDPGSGSSNTDTSQYPSHNYGAPGTYTVTLTVTDDHGQRATTSQPVYIDP